MIVKLIPIGGPQQLLAYLFKRDLPEDDRLWVCVRAAGASADTGWLGCWSSQNRWIDERDLQDFVEEFCERVRLGGRSGPYGIFLDEHYFFEGWDTWGVGTPLALEGRYKQREIIEAASTDHPLNLFARTG
ncbi:hypothetical protein OG799_03805 [Micromonospora sp. NBC_00898]|uniref:hypothetical protein n=1 Tax=Micromonospora sp. NBC_00898 TaxID=2975981 RepID=UPI00386B9F74|nr:hypothetical protein OG799_03805 [Micromonospora sp. NBC_00898]